ncbi:hypothetical protein AQUCO_03400050v1 [Aquilegia coerulea]|uniref:Uncharacterized protein n=1 Tax=Aquilegia coerulea TaxID=218851 RepID=A0A2G5CXD8_AQUCA|nr:hypothetical protein AQUCO_03400050v1 [Aquilegia coerulea]
MEEETSENQWEIVEKQRSGGGGGKMSLLYRVGKKIVITGAVISSAPFILPPLIVISSIGFAFAVPFGFVFASYACTDKIMSKLLSSSSPPTNDVKMFEDQLEEEGKEEEEFEEDMKKKLEMKIELVGDENETEEKRGFEEGIKEKGYEEKVGESEELDESEKQGNHDQLVPGTLEEKGIRDYYDTSGKYWDEEGPIRRIDAEAEEKKMVVEVANGFLGEKTVDQERDIPVEDGFYTIEDEGTKGTVKSIIEKDEVPYAGVMRESEGTGENETMEEYSLGKALQEEEVPFAGVMKAVEENGYKENGVVHEKSEPNAMVEKERPVFETKKMVNEGKLEDNLIEKRPVTQEKEVNILKKENAREIADESGLFLFEEETATSEAYNIPEIYKIREVTFEVDSLPQTVRLPLSSAMEEHSTVTVEDKNVGTVVHTVSAERVETKPANLASAEMKTTVSSKEVLYSEEKMWELIDAMRKIVGYKAAIQPTFADELKALYIFTGVEPPIPFEDQLDLVEANDKIRLLMAIIGVKI